jgi:WD40 repeat protein
MKKILLLFLFLNVFVFSTNIYTANLGDGSFETDWTFLDGNYARGVAIVDGIATLPQDGNLYIDISSGGGFRNVTACDSTITLSNRLDIFGVISVGKDDDYLKILGNNNTIGLSENQTFSYLKVTCKNVTIDCADNTITLSGSKVLCLAMGSELHLKNCTVNILNNDALFLESELSKLILEDSTLDLYYNCSVDKGSVEFRGNVLIKTSDSKSLMLGGGNHTIKSGGVVTISSGVSLHMTPSTSAEQFFIFEDSTSQLILDGITLTIDENVKGLFAGGNVVMKNGCITNTIKKTILQEVRDPSLDFDVNVRAVDWSPCGKYLAVAGDDNGTVGSTCVYYYDDGELSFTTSVGSENVVWWYTISWSPDGNYLAVGGGWGTSTKTLVIYSFDGLCLTEVASVNWAYADRFAYDISWHPNGNYIVAGGINYGDSGEDGFVVYAFDGSSLVQKGAKSGRYVRSLDWDPLGEYIAIGATTDNELEIYAFDVSTETLNTTPIVGANVATDMNIVRWRHDGGYLGVGDTSGNIYIYSFNRVSSAFALEFTKDAGERIEGLAWSPDGNYVAFTEYSNYLEVDRFYIDDAGEGSLSYIYGATFKDIINLNSVAFSPAGNTLAAGGDMGGVGSELKLFNFRGITFEEIAESQVEFGDYGKSCDWSFDGNYLAIIGSNPVNGKEVQVYKFDGENLTYATGVDYLGGDVRSVSWSPNGQYLAFGGGGNMKTAVYSFNSNTEELNFTFSRIYDDHDFADGFSVYGVDWSPSGNYLAVCGWVDSDHCDNICVYKFENDELNTLTHAPFPAPDLGYTSTYVRSVRWSPSENYLAAGGQTKGKIAVYSFDSSTTSLLLQDSESLSQDDYAVFSIDWSPNSEYLSTAGDLSLYVYFWNGTSLTEKYRDDNLTTYAYDLKWSNNGSYLAVGGQNLSSVGEDFKIYEFDCDEESLSELSQTKIYSPEIIYGVAWRSDDKGLAIAGQGNPDVKVYKFNGSMITSVAGAEFVFGSGDTFFDISPNENYIAVVGYDLENGSTKELQLLDATSDELTCLHSLTVSNLARSVDWSPDGEYIVITDANNKIHIYELSNETFQEVGSGTTMDTPSLNTARWSPCGKYIAVGMQNGDPTKYNVIIYEFDGDGLTELNSINIGSDYYSQVCEISWSPCGSYISLGGRRMNLNPTAYPDDHEIRIYEFDSSVPSLTYKDGYNCSGNGITCIQWNPDGDYLVTTGYEGWTQLFYFDGTTLTQKQEFDVGDPGCEVRWDPKGIYLIVCSQGDGTNNRAISFYNFDRSDEELSLLSDLAIETDAEYYATARWYSQGKKIAILGKSELKIYNWYGVPLKQASEMNLNYGVNDDAHVRSVAWSPDGNYLAEGGPNSFKVYDLQDGSLSSSVAFGDYAYSLTWSPDGNYLAVGGSGASNGNEVQIYGFDGSLLTSITGDNFGSVVYSLGWSYSGCYLAVGGCGSSDGNEIKIYGFDGSLLTSITGDNFGSTVYSLDWSSTGSYLAVGGSGPTDGNEVKVYTFDGASLALKDSENCGTSVYSVAWSSTNNYLAVGGNALTSGEEIKIYSFDGALLTSVTGDNYGTTVYSLDWSSGEDYLVVGGYDPTNGREIKVYGFNGSELFYFADLNYGTAVYSVNWSPDGNIISAGGFNPSEGQPLKLFDINRIISEEIEDAQIEFGQEIKTSAWSKDGDLFAITGLDNSGNKELHVYEFDGANLSLSYSIENAFDEIYSLDWSYTGSYLAVGANQSANKEVIVYKYEDDILQEKDSVDLVNDVEIMRWHPTKLILAAAGNDLVDPGGTDEDIVIYELLNDSLIRKNGQNLFTPGPPGVQMFEWSPACTDDYNYVALSKQAAFYVGYINSSWVYSTADDIGKSFSGNINSLSWSSGGDYFVVGLNNGIVSVCEYVKDTSITEKDTVDIGTEVYSVDWSPVGNFISVGGNPTGDNEEVQVYEFDTNTETLFLLSQTKKDFNGTVNKVEWHPSGDYMSVVGTGTPDAQIYEFSGNVLSAIPTATLFFESGTDFFFDISPDGNYMVIIDEGESKLRLYDVSSHDELVYLSSVDCSAGAYMYISFSPNGNYVAVTNYAGSFRIYELNGSSLSFVCEEIVGNQARQIKWSPNGRYIGYGHFAADADEDELRVYRFNGDSVTFVDSVNLSAGTSWLYSLDFSPDGSYIAVAGSGFDGGNELQIFAFDQGNGTIGDTAITGVSTKGLLYVSWNPDGKYLLAGEFSGGVPYAALLYYFDGSSLTLKDSFEKDGTISSIAWDPTGQYVIIGHGDQVTGTPDTFYICEFDKTTETLFEIPGATVFSDVNYYSMCAWFPDGDRFAIGGRSDFKVYDWYGQPLQLTSNENIDYWSQVRTVKWSSGGNYLAVGGKNPVEGIGEIDIYEFDENKTLELLYNCSVSYGDHGIYVLSADWSPDDKFLAVGGGANPTGGHELQVYKFDEPISLRLTTSMDYGDYIYSVVWSPDGNYLAVGGKNPTDNKELKIYYLNSNDYLETVTSLDYGSSNTGIRALEWSADGQYLATAGSEFYDAAGQFRIYEFNSTTSSLSYIDGKKYSGTTGINDQFAVAWAPSGSYVAVGGYPECNLRIYSFDGSDLSVDPVVNESFGTNNIYSIDWSPCGNYLVVGPIFSTRGEEIQIYYFDGSTLTFIDGIDYGSYVYEVDWSPNGRYLAVGGGLPSDDKEIKIYPVSWIYSEIPVAGETAADIEISDALINASKNLTLENITLHVK